MTVTPPPAPITETPSVDRHRTIITATTLVVGIATVALLTSYNLGTSPVWDRSTRGAYRTWEEYLLVNISALFFPSLLLILVALREPLSRFGMRPSTRRTVLIAAGLYAVMLPLLVIASRIPAFQVYYPIQKQAAYSWAYLAYFELTYGFYLFTWEWFYRGFLTFGLAQRLGAVTAIVLQAIAFCLMHVGKPVPEVAGSFIAGLALGALAIRGRSFLPCFALHWAIAITFDLLVIHAIHGVI